MAMVAIEIPQFAEFVSAVARQLPRDIDSALAQRWIDDQGNLAAALRNALCQATQVGTAVVAPTTTTEWQKFFGHLRVWDSDFNETHYPLGTDPGDEAEELGLDRLVSGHEAVAELFKRLKKKREGASLWAQGRYIKAHPEAQKKHPLLGIGAQWQGRFGDVWFPVFSWYGDKPSVNLNTLDNKYDTNYRFLVRQDFYPFVCGAFLKKLRHPPIIFPVFVSICERVLYFWLFKPFISHKI